MCARIAAALLKDGAYRASLPSQAIIGSLEAMAAASSMLQNSVPFCHTRVAGAFPLARAGLSRPALGYRLLSNEGNRVSREQFMSFGEARVAADAFVGNALDSLGRPPLPPSYFELCEGRKGVLAIHGRCGMQLVNTGGA